MCICKLKGCKKKDKRKLCPLEPLKERVINIREKKKQVSFRVTEEEYKKLSKKIEKLKLKQNKYFLRCGLDKKINVVDGLPELVVEIKKI